MTSDESKHRLETMLLKCKLLLLRMKYIGCWKSSQTGVYTCSVSKYWKKEARAWMPGSTLEISFQQHKDKLHPSPSTNPLHVKSDRNYLISPVRLAARAVLCLANTSLHTWLLTCRSIILSINLSTIRITSAILDFVFFVVVT